MKKNKNKKYWIIGGIVLLLLIVLAVVKSGGDEGDTVEISKVEKRKIVEMVAANGKIQPEVDIIISPEVSGKITDIHVKEGQKVKKGDLLLTLNPDNETANVNRGIASLNTARSNLSNSKARLSQVESQFNTAEKSYSRNKTLYEQGVISDAEYESNLNTYHVAKAEFEAAKETVNASSYAVKSAEATLTEASDNLRRTSIYAPDGGIITALRVEVGETALGTSLMSGTELMRVSKLDTMEVDVEVNESDIVKVSLSDTAFVEVDAYLDRKFKGVVTEIANAASGSGMSVDQVTNFSVKIRILPESYLDLLEKNPGSYSPFRSGMSATVEIQTDIQREAISVPIEAVTTRTDTSSKKVGSKEGFEKRMEKLKKTNKAEENEEPIECVFIYSDGHAKLMPVKTGVQDSKYIQILEGLNVDVEIIIGPYSMVSKKLENGDRVSKKEDSKGDEKDKDESQE